MNIMSDITLESLIQEHNLIEMMYRDGVLYYFRDHQAYEYWLTKARRYLFANYINDQQVVEFDTQCQGPLSKNTATAVGSCGKIKKVTH